MILRHLHDDLRRRLGYSPGVVLLGPRQVGKTTLARTYAAERPGAIHLDLERASDRARLADPELFFEHHRQHLIVLDEVQCLPDIFRALRPEIDGDRRPGRFLLLGSASGPLLRQTSESLAGRVAYLELTPLLATELSPDLSGLQTLLLRGGFPLSHVAPTDEMSFLWRDDFIRTFLERDLPQLGVTIPASTLHRFWRMLGHLHGQLFNASQLGLALGGVSHATVARYLDLLVGTMMVRRLEPVHANLGKRLVKAPKIYIRDSGILHCLLDIRSVADLQGHPVVGASWEGFVVEQIAAHAPAGAEIGFYRTAAGAELDVVVTVGGRRLGFEIKFSSAPKPTRGFWQAMKDLEIERAWIVAPVANAYPLAERVDVIPVTDIRRALMARDNA
ncbi:MAG: ATP-binding protein [Sulfurimicrobium sp.]|nr:ATP-binding protein [Sulfurimicrobium sp.]